MMKSGRELAEIVRKRQGELMGMKEEESMTPARRAAEGSEKIVRVSIKDVDMPAYGAYRAASALAGEAQIMINFALCFATAMECNETPGMVMTEVAAHELGHALEDVFGRLFSEMDTQKLSEIAAGVEIETIEDTEYMREIIDYHGRDITEMTNFGYEQGRASVLNAPMTSVIQWHRYDGTLETLPEFDRDVLAIPQDWGDKSYGIYQASFDEEGNEVYWHNINGWGEKAAVGDLWAYLPTPPAE